jgi:hypothetical protein
MHGKTTIKKISIARFIQTGLCCSFHRLFHKVTSMQSELSKQSNKASKASKNTCSFRCILSEGTVVVGLTKKYVNPQNGTDMLSRNVGKKLPLLVV